VAEWSVGARLVRFRVFLGFALAPLVWWLARPTFRSLWAGTVVAAAGEAVRLWAAGHLQKSREVTASGPYRWCAHPLYAGSALMGAGLAMASARPAPAALILAYLAAALTTAAAREAAFLRRTHGEAYDRYRKGVVDRTRRFSWALAMANREYRAIAGLLAAVGLLALKAARGV